MMSCCSWNTYVVVVLVLTTCFIPAAVVLWLMNQVRRRMSSLPDGGKHVAFFHPNCMSGGGGERVLWTAVYGLTRRYPTHRVYVYADAAAGPVTRVEASVCVRERFGLDIPDSVQLVPLRLCRLLEPHRYPVLTLLGQSLGSILLAMEAMYRLLPDVYVDTTGCAFSMPVFRLLGGCSVACYVHYPTVSSSMIARVGAGDARPSDVQDTVWMARRRRCKVLYYRLFGALYGWTGAAAHVVMCNSRWTAAHIDSLWPRAASPGAGRAHLVYPPCDVRLLTESVQDTARARNILSVAQFRPEKDHQLQLRSFARLLRCGAVAADVRLLLVGGCRDAGDRRRVHQLEDLAASLGVCDRVDFHVNVPYDRLQLLYRTSLVGLHTMLDEHFGIGIVEMMAAGLIVIAHNSGGPRSDIITVNAPQRTGYLATTELEYCDAMRRVLEADPGELDEIRARAKESVDRFSVDRFDWGLAEACRSIL